MENKEDIGLHKKLQNLVDSCSNDGAINHELCSDFVSDLEEKYKKEYLSIDGRLDENRYPYVLGGLIANFQMSLEFLIENCKK